MLFVATLSHGPDLCFARPEFTEAGRTFSEELAARAQELGVKVHAALITPNEHTFYFVLEADRFEDVSEVLGPPILTHHTGRVAPVMPVPGAFALSFVQGAP